MVKYIGIVSFCKNRGIGFRNEIPWDMSTDLVQLENLTKGHIVVMGYSTYSTLLTVSGRLCDGRTHVVVTPNDVPEATGVIFSSVTNIDKVLAKLTGCCVVETDVFVIGGEKIYEHFMNKFEYLYVTYLDRLFDFHEKFPEIDESFELVKFSNHGIDPESGCVVHRLEYQKTDGVNKVDREYTELCKRVLKNNEGKRNDRTGTGTFSIFGDQIRFDISKSIPILTTKRIPWKSCIEELLWFLRGDTDANILKGKGVNIWNGNSSKEAQSRVGLDHLREGDCGANYSFQWRYFGQEYISCETPYKKKTKYDQIQNIIHLLKTDPHSRRIFMSSWNPMDLDNTVLPPCHVSAQFYVSNDGLLSCHMYQRSCDVFLGLPWNILSYSILTHILAAISGYEPGELVISLGDTHIYMDHVHQVEKQIMRKPMSTPVIVVSKNMSEKLIEDICVDDFEVYGYFPHTTISARMSV